MNRSRAWTKRILFVGIAGLAVSIVAFGFLEALIRGWVVLSPVAWGAAWGLVIAGWICLVVMVGLFAWALILRGKE
jgi:hypothetical protein